jgi:hypothetical protein
MNIGRPLPLSEAILANLSQVTETDLIAARALVQATAPRRYRDLLESPMVRPSVTVETPLAWDPTIGRYIYTSTRRPVNPLEIRNQVIEPIILRSRQVQRSISTQLQTGEIQLAEWQAQMITTIKQAHVATALAANGGEKNTNDNDKEEIAALILILLLLLQDFSTQIWRRQQALNGLLLVRSDLYAAANRGTFESMGGYVASAYLGKTEERRLLSPAEHCETDKVHGLQGCVELATLGWQPIGSLPRIGKSPCRSNCKCRMVYR